MDGPARPASARPHRQGWPSPTRIGLRLACSKALERLLALMGRHLARASEANAALLGSLAALAGPGGRGPKMRSTFFGRARMPAGVEILNAGCLHAVGGFLECHSQRLCELPHTASNLIRINSVSVPRLEP